MNTKISSSSSILYISIVVFGKVFDSEKSVLVNSNLPVGILFFIKVSYLITGVYWSLYTSSASYVFSSKT